MSSEFTSDALEGLTVKALKQLLTDRGLKVGGRKAELIERLLAFEAIEPQAAPSPAPSPSSVVAPSLLQAAACAAMADAMIGDVVDELVVGAFDEVFDSSLDEEQSSKTSLELYIRQSTGGADSTADIARVLVEVGNEEEDESVVASAPPSPLAVAAASPPPPAEIAAPALSAVPARLTSSAFAQAMLSPTMLLSGDNNLPMMLHTADGLSSASVSPLESPYQPSSCATSASKPAQQHSPQQHQSPSAVASTLRIGTRIAATVKDKRQLGTIKYIGVTDFMAGEWCGVQLDEPVGNHDGTVQNVRYFHCAPKHGVFVRPAAVTAVVADEKPASASKKPQPLSASKPNAAAPAAAPPAATKPAAAAATTLVVGQRVAIKGRGQHAIVRYIGPVRFAEEGEWLGLQLQTATGKNDGSVKGERYFECAPKFGLFVRADAVAPIGK